MRQSWRSLAFLHWRYPAAEVAALLPAGLTLDTWEGEAWVGLVPFLMDQVRLRSGLRLPTATTFPETNVRTYVLGPDGRPGVYFFSLDAASRLAVLGGQLLYGLPYRHARMSLEPGAYSSQRPLAMSRILVTPQAEPAPAEPGTHLFWLVERYLLFSSRGCGQVWHEPYQVCEAKAQVEESLLSAAGLTPPGRPPDLAHFSAGVDVDVWPIRRVR
jgi:uncharacterized protein YqjF (DUF2071 family)